MMKSSRKEEGECDSCFNAEELSLATVEKRKNNGCGNRSYRLPAFEIAIRNGVDCRKQSRPPMLLSGMLDFS